MTLEATLERIAIALETIAKQGGSVAQATAELGKPEPAAPAPAKGKSSKKDDAATAAATPAASTSAATTAAPATSATNASPTDAGPDWVTTLAKIQELNKGTGAGQGRDGVLALLAHYGLTQPGGTVPKLEALNKTAEIIAFVDARLKPAAAAAAPAEEANLF